MRTKQTMNSLLNFFELGSEAIAWTLLHSLWQGAIIGLLLWLVLFFQRKRPSGFRFSVSMVALVLLLGSFVFTFIQQYQWQAEQAATNPIVLDGVFMISGSDLEPVSVVEADQVGWKAFLTPYLPFLSVIWLLGVVFCLLRFSLGLRAVMRLRRKGHQVVSKAHDQLFERLKLRLGIRHAVQLIWSDQVQVPMVIGHFKPMVLFPVALINRLDLDQVEAILTHELAHVMRRDYLWNLLLSFAEILLFFHPV
ncbi:MAG: M56 family metallopeptidase, partial [Bacteroidota bacterium]